MSGSDTNLNAQVLASLTRLADTLAKLDETKSTPASCTVDEVLLKGTAALSIGDNSDLDDELVTQTKAAHKMLTSISILPSQSISHWRTLPADVKSAYQLLVDGASYIHATSTKYTLISNTGHTQESGNLAVELRKGAELLGTGSLLLFSESCGASRSLKHYVKVHVRAVVASVVSLLQYFEDINAGGNNDTKISNNNVGAQKTGAIWSACDKLTSSLPRGNRAAMRRDLMVWMRDCNESIAEFEGLVSLGPKNEEGENNDDVDEDEDDEDDNEQYTEKEIKLAKASVNLIKCTKNVLNLVMSACEFVGGNYEDCFSTEVENPSIRPSNQKMKNSMLQYISNLHDRARSIGVGVTDFGVLLYPPLDMELDMEEVNEWLLKKTVLEVSGNPSINCIPELGTSTLGLKLECHLHTLLECVEKVRCASMSRDVIETAERLLNAVHIRCKEIEEAIGEITCKDETE